MKTSSHPVDRAFEALPALIHADPALSAELVDAARTFGGGPPSGEGPARLWHRRMLEWFVLERVGGSLRAPPLDELLEAARSAGAESVVEQAASLRGSMVGVFAVTGIEPGRGLWLRDLAARGEYPIAEADVASFFRDGDLIAGRLFPLEDGSWHMSAAAGFFRNPKLLAALENDLEKARGNRRGFLRVSQLEIERMFFATSEPSTADPVGEVRALLAQSGVEPADVDAILERLASEPFDEQSIVVGSDEVLADVLDRLAFETAVDLDRARELLVLAWRDLAKRGPGAGASIEPRSAGHDEATSPKVDVQQAVAEFERRREQGVPLERAFDQLANELGLDAEPGEEDLAPAPDFPGVVGAVIEEFLWESSELRGEPRAELESVRSFGRFAAHVGVFENLTERDLVAYTCHWLPENGGLQSADEARAHLVAFTSFCRWVAEAQGLDLYTGLKSMLRTLESSLPRVVEANRRRTRTSDPMTGALHEVVSLDERGAARLRDRAGDERDVEIDPELAHWLRAGDLLRARVHDDGRVAVYCCYPPEARALLGS